MAKTTDLRGENIVQKKMDEDDLSHNIQVQPDFFSFPLFKSVICLYIFPFFVSVICAF